MYKLLSKNGQTLGFLLGAVITLLFVLSMSVGWEKFSAMGDSPERYNTNIFNFGIFAAIALIILGLIIVSLFGIAQLSSNPKGALRGIIGVVLLVGIFLFSYSTSSAEAAGPLAKSVEAAGVSGNGLKLIGGGIATALILSLLASASIVISELRNFFK